MRKLISILLLAVFSFPFVLPMLALGQDAEAGLPACCRRNGKHHCMMSVDEGGQLVRGHGPQFAELTEKCPSYPLSVASTPPDPLAPPLVAAAIYGELVSHPAVFAQIDARRRISRDRSNGKRGPPTMTQL